MGCSVIDFMRSNLRLSSGCTEPAAIALTASWISSYITGDITSISLRIDPKTYKNTYAVGIPNSDGLVGNEWAVLFGLATARPDLSLEIFTALNETMRKKAIAQALYTPVITEITRHSKLFIEITVTTADTTILACTKNTHTNLTTLKVNNKRVNISSSKNLSVAAPSCEPLLEWYEPDTWHSLVDTLYHDTEFMEFMRVGIIKNLAVADFGKKYISLDDDYGVSAAIFTRMSGDVIPVMSCAGSGNKGLTAIIPAVRFARENNATQEEQEKASLYSTLLTSLITARFGAVSSVCGAFYGSGVGFIAAILYIQKRFDLFFPAYKNYMAAVTGAYCDGAKGSCSVKGRTAVLSALKSIQLAETGFSVSEKDGVLGSSFADTLNHLARYTEHFGAFDDETIFVLKNK